MAAMVTTWRHNKENMSISSGYFWNKSHSGTKARSWLILASSSPMQIRSSPTSVSPTPGAYLPHRKSSSGCKSIVLSCLPVRLFSYYLSRALTGWVRFDYEDFHQDFCLVKSVLCWNTGCSFRRLRNKCWWRFFLHAKIFLSFSITR